jgi:hypothetical protein
VERLAVSDVGRGDRCIERHREVRAAGFQAGEHLLGVELEVLRELAHFGSAPGVGDELARCVVHA